MEGRGEERDGGRKRKRMEGEGKGGGGEEMSNLTN